MINCLIIDDEPLALKVLEDFVKKTPFLKLLGRFEEPMQGLPLIESKQVDLLFLDIKMPDISGIDFFKSLRYKPQVIFTTAYSEYAINGFELQAMDYLLKPISFDKFIVACSRVKEYLDFRSGKDAKAMDYFFINASHKLHKIFYDDILYLEGYKDYTKIYLSGSAVPLLVLHNLKYFAELLNGQGFIRIHRSYIIQMRKVSTVSRKSVTINNQSLPVSDHYRENLFALIERSASL